MTLFMTEPPSAAPVTLAEAKAFMRVDTGEDDALIGDLIAVAVAHLEAETGIALMSQGWRLCLDDWPCGGVVALRRTPVQTIDAVTLYDADGKATDLDVSAAVLDGRSRPARLLFGAMAAPGRPINGIEIDFTAGFGDAATDVPDTLKQAIRLHVAHLYEFRGAVPLADQPAGVPSGYARLVGPFSRRAI